MAVKEIKTIRGTFEFTGLLTGNKLVPNKDATKNGRWSMTLTDKVMESEVTLDVWEQGTARYWSTAENKIVEVKDNIEAVMREVKANAIGNPFGIVIKGKTETMCYTNNMFIEAMKKVPEKKYRATVTGDITFEMYNNRVQKRYNVKTIELNKKDAVDGFIVKVPMALSPMAKAKFQFTQYATTIPVLVKAKLEDKTNYGYRATQLVLDPQQFLGGAVDTFCKTQQGMDTHVAINETILKVPKEELTKIDGFVIGNLLARLKVGTITKKPTVADLNPMELAMLQMQGEEALKRKLDNMELITEYSDSLILHSIDFDGGRFFDEISENDLKLDNGSSTTPTQQSNPMMDAMASFLNTPTTADTPSEVVEEVVAPTVDLATSDELDELVAQAEKEATPSAVDSFDDSEFPFN